MTCNVMQSMACNGMPAWRDVAARKIVGWPPLFFFFFFCYKHRRKHWDLTPVATTAHGRRFKPRRVLGPQPPTCGDVLCWSRPQSGAGIYWQLVEAIFIFPCPQDHIPLFLLFVFSVHPPPPSLVLFLLNSLNTRKSRLCSA